MCIRDSSFTTHDDGNELELTGNRAGLLLLAKAALGMAETIREDGFHIHLDDLYDINAEGKSILIRKMCIRDRSWREPTTIWRTPANRREESSFTGHWN